MGKVMLLVFIFFYTVFAGTSKWNIKTENVKISYNLPKKNRSGALNGLEAEIEFSPADLAVSRIIAKANVSSLQTADAGMTAHLLTADFFDVGKYPNITFVSGLISKTDSGFFAKGDLTLKDKTKNVESPFTFLESDGTGLFKGKMSILCGDFDLMSHKENDSTSRADITIEVPVMKQ